jgi:surface antigen
MERKLKFWLAIGMMLVIPYDVFGEQSCCDYTMPDGIENHFGCYEGNCVWWAVYNRNDLNFMVKSPETADCPGCWIDVAKSHGYTIGSTPEKGAIVVYTHGFKWGKYGHVAYVESVSGKKYTVSEMGYNSWNCVRKKTRKAGRYKESYIYEKRTEIN